MTSVRSFPRDDHTAPGAARVAGHGPRDPLVSVDLPVLLPDIPDGQDACVERLAALIAGRPGVTHVHVVQNGGGPTLCLHYDPAITSIDRIERLAMVAGAEVTSRYGHALFALRAIDGEDAALRIEHALRRAPGVLAASANLAAQEARVEFDRTVTSADRLASVVQGLGYGLIQREAPVPAAEPATWLGWYSHNKELAWALIAGVLLAIGWIGESFLHWPPGATIALFAGAYLFGAYDLVSHLIASIRRRSFGFDIDLLMLLAAIGAAVLGEWAEGAFLLFLFALAHALEHYALGRARNAIAALADLAPPVATVLRDGRPTEVPVDQVLVGDVVMVRPGERIPTDGTVRSGISTVNQAPITGESIPVEKAPGMEVFAGTINGEGALEVATTHAAGDRTLDRVIQLVEEAQTQKAPTQRFTERFARIFVPTVLAVDLLVIVAPPLLGILDWRESFYRGMTLLVAASPCALALGTPSAVLAGIAQAARQGVLIKGGQYLESLGTLRAIALDKTGTLTRGVPEVMDVAPLTGVSAQELLTVAAAVERRSQHPLAKAVVRRAEAEGLVIPDAGDLQSLTGKGVRAELDGRTVEIGNPRLWQEAGVEIPPPVREVVERLQPAGRSIMIVREAERWLGVLGFADQPRRAVREVIERLRSLGIRPIVMLTGDNAQVGEAIGRALGVDEVRADLLPEDKLTAIQELQRRYGAMAMVGDGVNDAPALANATVGIAMGGAGTAVALETADVALMADDLGQLPFAVGLSRRARAIIRQNLAIALGAIGFLIVASVSGRFGIGPAVVVHEGVTIVVILNALRLLTYNAP